MALPESTAMNDSEQAEKLIFDRKGFDHKEKQPAEDKLVKQTRNKK